MSIRDCPAISATAIITSYNENIEQINKTLASCLSQTIPFSRIVLVNDGSYSFIRDALIQHESIEVIDLKTNHGIAGARNKALATVNSRFVAILNVEIQLVNTWLERSLEILKKNSEVGVVYGKLIAAKNNLITKWRFQFHEQKYANEPGFASFAPGHAAFFYKKLIDKVGGYDERLKLVHEDADICFRIQSSGYNIFYDPTIVVISLQTDSYRSIGKKHAIRITVGELNNLSFLSFFTLLIKDHTYRIIRNVYKRRFLFALIDWRISFESLKFFNSISK